jgi:hypothetical protein
MVGSYQKTFGSKLNRFVLQDDPASLIRDGAILVLSTRTYNGTKLQDHDFAKRLRQAEFTLDPSADGFVVRGATSPEV